MPLTERLRRSDWTLVVGLWALATLAVAFATRGISDWYVMTDELTYVKQSITIADHLRPALSSDPYFNSYSELLPLLGAPFFGLFSVMTALKLFHVVAALVMTSTLVPVFLLARDVTRSRWLAALAGALTVAVPWIAMTGGFMSEIVAYPATGWAFFAIHRACVRPGPRADVLALVAIAVACLARTQLVLLAGVLVVCVVVHEAVVCGRDRVALKAALARHRVLVAVAAAGAVVGLLILLVPSVADAVLGNYGVTAKGGMIPSGIGTQTRFMIATNLVALGVAPFLFALAYALAAVADRRDRAVQAAGTLILVGGAALIVQAGWFTKRYNSYDDRYLLYIAPLLMVGFAALLERPWRARFTAIPAVVFVWWSVRSVAVVPSPAFFLNSVSTANYNALHDWSKRLLSGPTPNTTMFLAATFLLALALALSRVPRRWLAPVLVGLPFLLFATAATGNILQRMRADWNAKQVIAAETVAVRGWVDRAVGDGTPVATLLGDRGAPGQAPFFWWETAFWNKSLKEAYTVLPDGNDLGHNYTTDLRISSDGRLENLRQRYVVVPSGFPGFGFRDATEVASEEGLVLLKVGERPQLAWRTEGMTRDSRLSADEPLTLTLYPEPSARRCSVRFDLGPVGGNAGAVTVRWKGDGVRGGSVRVRPDRAARATVPLRAGAGEPAGLTLTAEGATTADNTPASVQLTSLAVDCHDA